MHGIGQLLYILTIPKVTYALQSWSPIFRRRNSLKEITENTLKIVGKGGGLFLEFLEIVLKERRQQYS